MRISVAGTGLTKFGEAWDKSLEDLSLEASQEALAEAKLSIKDIDAIFVGNMLYGKVSGQDHLGSVVSSLLNFKGASFRVEGACASGGLAVHLSLQSLIAGTYKNVLVVGAEKMTDVGAPEISSYLMGAGSEAERLAGLTFPGLYALMAQAHMKKFKTSREDLAKVAVKNHYHASLNSKAQFQSIISVEQVLSSTSISSPFTLFDASPITDGAAAVVLSSDPVASAVYISGSGVATDDIDLSSRESLTELKATKQASLIALKQAGVEIKDINIAEVHDCFTIAEILAMEDLGFCPKGQGGKFISQKNTYLEGKLPVNTSGGLKACGHPVGATGVKQIVEITHQLRGSAGKRQVKNLKVGLTQNVGGTGATVVVHILQT